MSLYRFMFTLITTLVNGNFNNGVVIRPNMFKNCRNELDVTAAILTMWQDNKISEEE
jgi:hypothetical protein